jgi:hypothetical protein
VRPQLVRAPVIQPVDFHLYQRVQTTNINRTTIHNQTHNVTYELVHQPRVLTQHRQSLEQSTLYLMPRPAQVNVQQRQLVDSHQDVLIQQPRHTTVRRQSIEQTQIDLRQEIAQHTHVDQRRTAMVHHEEHHLADLRREVAQNTFVDQRQVTQIFPEQQTLTQASTSRLEALEAAMAQIQAQLAAIAAALPR